MSARIEYHGQFGYLLAKWGTGAVLRIKLDSGEVVAADARQVHPAVAAPALRVIDGNDARE